jgi:hypothetical protein
MKRLLVLLFILLLAISAYAQESQTITYQGEITNVRGEPITASYAITFRFYDSEIEGELLWEEVRPDVSIEDGTFYVNLGEITPIPSEIAQLPTLYMGIAVADGQEFAPRMKIGIALRSMWADEAAVASVADHATDVSGENIHPATVSIGDQVVINSEGQWSRFHMVAFPL